MLAATRHTSHTTNAMRVTYMQALDALLCGNTSFRIENFCAEQGFLAINDYLQSAGGPPEIFACGDVASSVSHPRPKAGVFAVRQGPPLADNLRRFLTAQPLKRFVPQQSFMGLITTGHKHAILTKGPLAFSGDWLWQWKDRIDQAFMRKFGADLPAMQQQPGAAAKLCAVKSSLACPV